MWGVWGCIFPRLMLMTPSLVWGGVGGCICPRLVFMNPSLMCVSVWPGGMLIGKKIIIILFLFQFIFIFFIICYKLISILSFMFLFYLHVCQIWEIRTHTAVHLSRFFIKFDPRKLPFPFFSEAILPTILLILQFLLLYVLCCSF